MISQQDKATVVAFQGDVDLESSPEARKILLAQLDGCDLLLVDMSEVNYIDSSGIASLVESFQTGRAKGKRFALVSVSEPALRVLQLARLDKVFDIHENVEAALAAG
ncbi:STAS domain-containing protein [Magnetospira sp. QH-2]|uniref:STAS domain-containing protein n=1 Tax=Magnetospira sp. (strain QH-2) TaxID=1288970 RepID=UPI0035272CF3